MLIRKEVIRPGTYWYTDEKTGQPSKFVATPELSRYWHDTGKQMLADGLSIPVPLEHQRDASPLTAAQRAANILLNNAGWVKDYELEGDRLYSIIDVEDSAVAKKLPTTIKWTSPWINSFTDGNGKEWKSVISHLALTSRPRITKQDPFPSISAAMSLFQTRPETPREAVESFALSRAGLLLQKDGQFVPAFPMAFSLWSGGVKLGVDDLKKGKDKKETDPGATGSPAKTDTPTESPTDKTVDPLVKETVGDSVNQLAPQVEQKLIDTDGDISVYSVLKDLLGALDIQLPDDTSKDNFHEYLYAAVMEKVKGMGAQDPMQPTPKPTDTTPPPPLVQETQPMYMSMEQVNAITDPEKKSMALSLFSLQQKNEKNEKRLAATEKSALDEATRRRQARIDRILKRSPDEGFRTKLIEATKGDSVKLSVGDDGQIIDPLQKTLDLLEAGIKDLPALLTVPGNELSMLEHPRDYTGDMTEDRRKAVVAELETNAGLNRKAV